MQILIVTPFFTPQTGGVTTYIEALRRDLEVRGHTVHVLRAGESDAIVTCPRVRDSKVWSAYLRPLWCPEAPVRGVLAFLAYALPTLVRLARFVRANRIEVVSIEYPLAWMAYWLPLRWWTGVRTIVGLHGDDVLSLHLLPRHERWLVRRLVRSADLVLAHSSRLLKDAERIVGRLPSHRGYLPYWVNCAELRDQARRTSLPEGIGSTRYVLTVAKLYHRKGIDVLLRALAKIAPAQQNLRFVIVGDGPEERALRADAVRLGLENLVVFAGDVRSTDIPALIAGCEFFLLPSRSEPFGIVLLEAMTFGKAVLATRVGGIPEFIKDGVNGLLVSSEDSGELSAAIERLLTDASLRERLARTGLSVIEDRYDQRALGPRYEALFASVVAGDPSFQEAACLG